MKCRGQVLRAETLWLRLTAYIAAGSDITFLAVWSLECSVALKLHVLSLDGTLQRETREPHTRNPKQLLL